MPEQKPILQLALDFPDLHRAIQIAKESVKGGVDWIEVGTPLIKSEGLNAVREIKRKFSRHVILADMKTMDTGSFEVEIAAKSGADIIIILALADTSTIKEAVEAGKKYNTKIMVDLIGVEDPITKSAELEKIGIDYICIHVGIDQQMKGMDPLKTLTEVAATVKIPLALAGGINSESAAKAVTSGAKIVIIGGAITKAENARAAAKIIKKAMSTKKPIPTRHYKKFGQDDLQKVLLEVSPANISDAMHRKGEMIGINPITPKTKISGTALTVQTFPGDWAKAVEAIDLANPGQVIVIDAGGSTKAVWGELASWSCKTKDVAGVVIDGGVRDVEAIREMNFSVFAKHINPTAGEPKGLGEINAEIICGGAKVRPGDWIVADDTGIIVLPRENAVEITNRAKDICEKEEKIKAEIKKKSTLSQVLQIKKWEKIYR